PEHLVPRSPVSHECLAKDGLTRGAELAQRAVSTSVFGDGACFEPECWQCVEHELKDQARRRGECSGAPESRANRESDFADGEVGINRSHLNQSDGLTASLRHDAKNGASS